MSDRPTCRLGYTLLQCEVALERGDIQEPECPSCERNVAGHTLRTVVPDCLADLVNLAREVAALRTWEELMDAEDEVPLKSGEGTLDDTVERARTLLDNWGLHGE